MFFIVVWQVYISVITKIICPDLIFCPWIMSFAVHFCRGLHSMALREKKKQNLRPVAPKVVILRLRHYQDSQVVVYIDFKLWTSKLTKKQLFREKLSKRKSYLVLQDPSFNFILKEYAYTVTYTRLDLAMRYSI